MRIPVLMTVAATLVAGSGAAAEQTNTFGGLRIPPRDSASNPQAAGRRDPYGQLFGGPLKAAPRVAPSTISPKTPATPTITCGMTLIPGDPQVDPGIAAPRPPDSQRFHSRTVEPTICR